MFLIRSSTPFVRTTTTDKKECRRRVYGNKYKNSDFVDSLAQQQISRLDEIKFIATEPKKKNSVTTKNNNQLNRCKTTNVDAIFVYYIR